MNDMSNDRATIGGNNPPATLLEELQERYKADLDRAAEVKDAAQSVPDVIDNDDVQTRVAELIKKMRFVEKTLDGAREIEREPHAKKVTEVNGFFKTKIEPLEALRKTLNERSAAYLEKKAAAERRKVQEEEERRRAKAAEDMRLAQEAEEKKRAAEAAQRKAEADALAAQQARDKAIQDAKDAEARAEAAKVREAEMKAQAIKRAAEDALLAKAKMERDAEEQAQRDAQKAAHEIDMANAKAAREADEKLAAEARAQAAKALIERRDHEEAARVAKAEVKTANRDEQESLASAVREEKRADRLADVAAGPEADLARTRSEHGAVSTLARVWKYRVVNADLLDMRALWPHVSTEEKEIAFGKWAKLQPPEKRQMYGAVAELETVAQVR
jgi:hypothetical protein